MASVMLVLYVSLMALIGGCYGDHHGAHMASAKILEMNYDLAEDTIHWPSVRPFTIVKTNEHFVRQEFWVANKEFCSNEHAGTHIDAPSHFAKGKLSVDQIPFDHLVDRPVVKVDISHRADADPDTRLEVNDLVEWEGKHGPILDGSVILMYSGWGKRFWPNKSTYYGTTTLNDTATYHFPGFHSDAAKWLIDNRNIYGIGVDTASADYGQTKDSLTHRLLNGEDIYILENVANVDQLPPSGAFLTVMPMKIRGGTGGPSRIFARIPVKSLHNADGNHGSDNWSLYTFLSMFLVAFAIY